MLDSITSNYQVIVLCTCFLNKCDATQVAEIVSNHQFSLIKEDERWNKIENSGRKRAEDAETKLQHLVKERTEELEDAYKSLKEREYYKLE